MNPVTTSGQLAPAFSIIPADVVSGILKTMYFGLHVRRRRTRLQRRVMSVNASRGIPDRH